MSTKLFEPQPASESTAAIPLGLAHERPETAGLIEVGVFHGRGWSLATSSNYSVVLERDPLRLLLTASGKDKGKLHKADFVIVDEQGRLAAPTDQRPSAETLLHVVLARQPCVGAVLHTHSVWGTLLSDWRSAAGFVRICGYEMLKGLEGVRSHEFSLDLPIFDNTQEIAVLAELVEQRLNDPERPLQYGFLIHRHGLYTWGRDLAEGANECRNPRILVRGCGPKYGTANTRRTPRRSRRSNRQTVRSLGMATVTIPSENRSITQIDEIREFLAPYGIWHEQWPVEERVDPDASSEEILAAYAAEVQRLMEAGGYVTADVINVAPETPGLQEMLDRFNKEHTHSEDEVRFIVKGRGVFHIHGADDRVFAIEVEGGDLINVPLGARHWFDLCADRTIRAIRLFQDKSGWTPAYIEGGVHAGYAPLCWGPII